MPGTDDPDPEDVERLFEHHLDVGLHHGAQLAVYRDGDPVLDLAGGVADPGGADDDDPGAWNGDPVTPETRFLLFSCTKPYAGACVHHLVDRGELAYDDRLVEFWPEYADDGTEKAATTVRHVLSHQAGVPAVEYDAQPERWADPDAGARAMEEAELQFAPGETAAYHAGTYGWLVRELVRRVAGVPVEEYAREHVFEPLGMERTTIGSDDPDDARLYGFEPGERCRDPGTGLEITNAEAAATFDAPEVRAAVAPASTGAGPAREMARFYACVAAGGALDGTRVLSEARVAEATAVARAVDRDATLGVPRRHALGFERAHPVHGGYGSLPPGRVVGHGGLGTCVGWADPELDLGVAYLTNGVRDGHEQAARASAMSDAVRRAFGETP